jgi:nicotinamidase-related amidase
VTIRLPVRFFVGAPASDPPGLVTEDWTLAVARAVFIELHCWNIGVPGGIPAPEEFWIYMGSQENHRRAAEIMATVIAPAMEAARRVNMPIVHVQPEVVARRYPNLRARRPLEPVSSFVTAPRVENHATRRADRVHGRGYHAWAGWEQLDVAPPVAPRPRDVMVSDTQEFHAWLAAHGKDVLFYTGFGADLSLLDAAGGMRAMSRLGYRCVLLREGTMAVEYHDQEPHLHTQAAIRHVEAFIGYTASAADFSRACAQAKAN